MILGKWINLHRLGLLFIMTALAIAVWGAVIESFYLSLAASVFVGFVVSTLWSYTYTLLQQHTHYDYYGRVIAYNDMIFLLIGGGTSLLIGVLVENDFALSAIAWILASVFALAALYYRWIGIKYTLCEIGSQ
jgi:hypothetical protein